jgi:hypothetical protein
MIKNSKVGRWHGDLKRPIRDPNRALHDGPRENPSAGFSQGALCVLVCVRDSMTLVYCCYRNSHLRSLSIYLFFLARRGFEGYGRFIDPTATVIHAVWYLSIFFLARRGFKGPERFIDLTATVIYAVRYLSFF